MFSDYVRISKKSILTIAFLFGIFIVYYTYLGYLQTELHKDHLTIALIELSNSNTQLFQHDYVFGDRKTLKFYYPLVIKLLTFLRNITGTFETALVFLIPIIMFIYLTGMFALLYALTHNEVIAFSLAIVSSVPRWSLGGTFWGVAGIDAVLARSLFLMFIPWVCLLFFWLWTNKSIWYLPIIAGLLGLLSNLHPVSGFFSVQLFLALIVFIKGINKTTIGVLGLSAIMAVVGVYPTLANFVSGTQANDAIIPFSKFAEIINIFYKPFIFPFPQNNLYISEQMQEFFVWGYVFAMVIWGIAYFAFRQGWLKFDSSRFFFLALLLIQLPLANVVARLKVTPLILIVGLYGVYRVWQAKVDKQDWWLLWLMTIIISCTFIANYFLIWLWYEFELISITTVMFEELRGAKFIYLPLYLYAARFMADFVESCSGKVWKQWQISTMIIALSYLLFFTASTKWVGLLGIVFVVQIMFHEKIIQYNWGKMGLQAIALMVVLRASIIPYQTFDIQTFFNSSQYVSQKEQDKQELYHWAKTQTDIDSLFYFGLFEFRFKAQRSITHSWVDASRSYYRRDKFILFYERYIKLNEGYGNPTLLLQYAEEYDVDYIAGDSTLSLNLPIAFQNDSYIVYGKSP